MVNPVDKMTSPASTATVVPLRSGTPVESPVRQGEAAGGKVVPVEAPGVQAGALAARESARELAEATRDVSSFIQSVSRSLQISVDGELGSTVIRVVDGETSELVRQIPSEEVLRIARYLRQQTETASDADAVLRGVLFNGEG